MSRYDENGVLVLGEIPEIPEIPELPVAHGSRDFDGDGHCAICATGYYCYARLCAVTS